MDAYNTVSTDNDDEIIIRINKVLSNPDEDVSLVLTFQVRYNCTRIDTAPMQFDTRSHFGIVLPNEDDNDTLLNLTLIVIDVGVPIRTPSNEGIENISMYKITSPLFCDLSRKFHAKKINGYKTGCQYQ